MYENPTFDANNEKILCEMNGKNADMLMDIKTKLLKAGESVTVCDEKNETAILLLSGDVTYFFDGKKVKAKRENQFIDRPYCVHFSKNNEVTVTANADSRVLIQQTDNENDFGYVWYSPETVILQEFGKDQWNGTAHRQVLTLFDYENAPYSNMVLGEVYNQPGRWSSYPPHHHPQPEVYYYQFDKPQGFGAAFVGDNVYKSVQGSAVYITDGNDHQQVVAPGYEMCYIWMIRHLDNDPWFKTTRFVSEEHQWLTK